METRKCAKCGEVKPVGGFSGKSRICLECKSAVKRVQDESRIKLNPDKKFAGTRLLAQQEASNVLWERGDTRGFLLDTNQLQILREFERSKNMRHVLLCSRRIGKCLAEGTQITTLNRGIVNIEDIEIGDTVVGYGPTGQLSPVKVTQKYDQGEKDVVDLMHQGRVVATCTEDHQWAVYDSHSKTVSVKRVKDFNCRSKIVRVMSSLDNGGKSVPFAYVLGALLGDGCARQNSEYRNLYISSPDSRVPDKVAGILGGYTYSNSEKNYTYCLSTTTAGQMGSHRFDIPYYKEWVSGRYSHEKLCDINEIKTWDRASKVAFVAGLIDTDGCLQLSDGCVFFSISMMAHSVIAAVRYLFLELWGCELGFLIDSRDKYKGAPCHVAYLKHNALLREVYKELDEHLVTPSKKWKPEYEGLVYQKRADFTGVRVANPRKLRCWDIGVDNDTHLYMLANGLITHNSWLLCQIVDEFARKNPKSRIKYLTTSTKAAKEIVQPLFGALWETCPAKFRPEYRVHDSKYLYSNGSEVLLHGVETDGGESLRGQAADLAIIDESGFIAKLDTLVQDVLNPMLIQRNGRLLLSSTPSRDNTHPFLFYIAKARADKCLTVRTLLDCPRFSQKQINLFIEEAGGRDSETCRREYFCEIIKNTEDAVVPEFNDRTRNKIVVSEFPKIEYVPDRYVSLDVGFVDRSFAVFAYFDFLRAKICIQREYISQSATTDEIAQAILKTERELWGKDGKVFKRYSDTDLRLIADLKKLYGIRFEKTEKDNKDASINLLRTLIRDEQIEIHESCVNLIMQLENGLWRISSTTGKRMFQRSEALGHLDGIDSMLYLIRNLKRNKNPIPTKQLNPYTHFDPHGQMQNQSRHQKLRNLFI